MRGCRRRPSARLIDSLMAEIRDEGPRPHATSTTGCPGEGRLGLELERDQGPLEYLFISGQLAVARRNSQFERVYDLPERVIPPAILERRSHRHETRVELVRRAARLPRHRHCPVPA